MRVALIQVLFTSCGLLLAGGNGGFSNEMSPIDVAGGCGGGGNIVGAVCRYPAMPVLLLLLLLEVMLSSHTLH
jgi:hypothetical protein